MTIAKPVEIVILAAGESKRFHGIKALAAVNGKAMLQGRIDALKNLPGTSLTAIVGAYRQNLESAVDFAGVKQLINPDWQEGIAASIRCAVAHADADSQALLFCAMDQVLVSEGQVADLIHQWRQYPDHMVAAYYNEQMGIPAIFPRRFWPRLSLLRGDRGAKAVLQHNTGRVIAVPMPEAGVDIDTQEELTHFDAG